MKNSRSSCMAALVCCAFLSSPVQAVVLNGGFESGTLDHWTIEVTGAFYRLIDPDEAIFLQVTYPFEAATVPWLAAAPSVRTGFFGLEPVQGSRMLSIENRQLDEDPFALWDSNKSFVGPDGNEYVFVPTYFTVSLSQELTLRAGDQVMGWAAMASEDTSILGIDHARVRIDGQNVWVMGLGLLEDLVGEEAMGELNISPWQSWSWTAPADGVYKLSLNVFGDDQQDTWGFFDGITVVQTIPEGLPALASVWLLAGVLGVAELWRRREGRRLSGSERS
jgi:hypothetical protein